MEIIKSATFDRWLTKLRDVRARTRIQMRVDRLALGNPGDVKPVGEGISEMRIDYGPGYRVYFYQSGIAIIVLLCGGDKTTQDTDITNAKTIAARWKEGSHG